MFTRLPAMVQNVLVIATPVFQGVTEDRHLGEFFFGVDGFGDVLNGGSKPMEINSDGTATASPSLSAVPQ
jgi:hypothetical protein